MNLPMDLLGTFEGNYAHYILRLVVAGIVGGLIGVEREYKGKPAGMRTNILMCLGSCLIMILSVEVARRGGAPGRIAAQVVTGVGFIGAGTILRSRVSVAGLTTAATIWFVAALGLVIGYGDFVMAGAATIFMIITLTALQRVERHFESTRQLHVLRLRAHGKDLARVREALKEARITAESLDIEREHEFVHLDVEYITVERKHVALVAALEALEQVDVLLHY